MGDPSPGNPPLSDRRLVGVLVVLALAWALALAWYTRYDRPAGHYSYPKVDAIAFQAAARLIAQGGAAELYRFRHEGINIDIERGAGLPAWAPRTFTIHRTIPGERFSATAQAIGYADATPPPFVYPPVIALLFLPMDAVPWPRSTFWLDTVVLSVLGLGYCHFVYTICRDRRGWTIPAALLLLVLTGISFPMMFSLFCGQVTPLVAGLTLFCLHRTSSKPLAIMIGIGAALIATMKIVPALLLPWFLLTRRPVQAWTMVAALPAIMLLNVATFGSDVMSQWIEMTRAITQGVRPWCYDQSVEAFLHRFVYSINLTQELNPVTPTPLQGLALLLKLPLVLAWGTLAWRGRQDGGEGREALLFAAFICLLVILPPVSWSHYGLLLFPAILALLAEALSRRGARRAGLLAVAACVYTVLALDMNKARDLYVPLQGLLGADTGSIVVRLLIGAPLLAAVLLYAFLCRVSAGPASEPRASSPAEPPVAPSPGSEAPSAHPAGPAA